QSRRTSTRFPLFARLNDDSTISNPGAALFGLNGDIRGAALRGGTFYGIQREIGATESYLVTIAYEGFALGDRVGVEPVGFSEIEGMANMAAKLVAVSVDSAARTTSLISIDCKSGVGTLIGTGPVDVIIVALAYDPVGEVIYGAGIPSGEVTVSNLYSIDPGTGGMTLVGALGASIHGLAWSDDLGLVGSFDHLYRIDSSSGAATQVGITDYTDGLGVGAGIRNGMYALAGLNAAVVSEFEVISITRSETGEVELRWGSDPCRRYQVQHSPDLGAENWTDVSDLLEGTEAMMGFTFGGAAADAAGYFRVVSSTP
ncbi:MAG: hypothetical protein ACI9UA_004353, partial [Pseudoalteromonas tetraodonis]